MKNYSGIYAYCTNCKYYEESKEVAGLELGKKGRTRNKKYTVYQWCDKDKKGMTTGVCLCSDFDPKITLQEFEKTDDYLDAIACVHNGKAYTRRQMYERGSE